MSTWRRLVRRGAPVLALTLALGLALPHPAEAGDWDVVGNVWSWFVELWSADGGDRGLKIDPDGTTEDDDRGAGIDPDGATSEEDRGAGLDPNG